MSASPITTSFPLQRIEAESPSDAADVRTLVDAAFGPGRFAKTAERLREASMPIPGAALVAREGERVVGTVRLWPVEVAGERMAFLGPLAVAGDRRRDGLGAQLIEAAFAAAEQAGCTGVLLVGDMPYFARFGFTPAAIRLPGPVDPARVLARMFAANSTPEGEVKAAAQV